MKISQRIKILMMCQIVCLTFFGVHASADEVTFDDKVKTIFQNEIWTEDIPNLTAEVAYQCTNTEKDATAYLSLYDADGRLIDVVAKKAHISPNSVETVTVQAENTTAAKKAKLLVFDNNLKPLKS